MSLKSLILASAFTATVLSEGHASGLAAGIDGRTLKAADTVAFLLLGVQDGAQYRFADGTVATVQPVGRTLTSNEPYGFEIRYGNGGPSLIVSVRQTSGCTYTLDMFRYSVSRQIFPNEKPEQSKMELDFSKAVAAYVVVGDTRRTGQVVGVQCTPVENADNECENIEKAGLATFASGIDTLKAFAYFQQEFCPRQ